MPFALAQCRSSPPVVGDPVDVVTRAVIDASPDSVQRGPIPLRLMGYYNSARYKVLGSRGWGHSHNFDCRLHRDLDGLRYEDPLGGTVGFQDLAISASDASGGMLLTR